ncbi:MAG: CBS domain-containing protein [Bacteriovoracaceae bacterium]|nr:CBS domain-containing protein [Bacteriovoracaceae bacterium]
MKKTADQIISDIKNLLVDEYSTPCSVTAKVSDSVEFIGDLMKQHGVRHIPIFKDGQLAGMVSDRDVRNLKDSQVGAGEIMSKDVYEVTSGTLLREVVFEMSSKKIGSTIVKDNESGEYSIFTSVDALNALNEILQ